MVGPEQGEPSGWGEFDSDGLLLWSRRLTWVAIAGGIALCAVAVAVLASGAVQLSIGLASVGAVLLLTGVSGALITRRRIRWAGEHVALTVSHPPAGPAVASRRRGRVGRDDPLLTGVLLGFAAIVTVLEVEAAPPSSMLANLALGLFLGSLLLSVAIPRFGPAVVVTADTVSVRNLFNRIDVPRGLVTGVSTGTFGSIRQSPSNGHIALSLVDGQTVTFTDGTRFVGRYANRRPASIRVARRIGALLSTVPEHGGTEAAVTRHRRTSVIALYALAALAFLTAVAIGYGLA